MTDRERQLIEAYIPSPPDPELEFGEYYLLYYGKNGERVRKVYATGIFPHEEGTEYDVYDCRTKARVDSGWNDRFRGWRMRDLYDNKTDCKDQSHYMYDAWEDLRKIQKKEGKQ